MDGLTGQIVSQTEVTSLPEGFFQIFAEHPANLVSAASSIYKDVFLADGRWGTVGSSITATYVEEIMPHTFVLKVTEDKVTALDETKKLITYTVTAGELLDIFTAISKTFQAGTQDGKRIVTWTIDYEKKSPSIPEPTSLMKLLVTATKEMDEYLQRH